MSTTTGGEQMSLQFKPRLGPPKHPAYDVWRYPDNQMIGGINLDWKFEDYIFYLHPTATCFLTGDEMTEICAFLAKIEEEHPAPNKLAKRNDATEIPW